uniref:Alginate export domain-containing protein n=1 Tax=Ignavibacterium album TaxID=591197 RepID=A0A7V2ZM42_9BACT
MKNSILTILFLLLFASTSLAQNDFEIGGYAKYLFSTAKYPQFDERLFDHIIHSRLNTKYFFDESLSLTGEFRFRTFFGNSVKKFPDYSELIKTNQPLLKLDWMIWKNQNTIGYAEADRLYFDYNANNFQLTLGKQRIAWGTSWVWNPTDLFNPLSILDFDYEELPGSDALRIQYYTGAVSKIEFAIAPNRNKDKLTAAGLVSINAVKYDFNFLVGVKNKKWFAGFSWVGDIADAGFRGELLLMQKPDKISKYDQIYNLYNESSLTETNNLFFSFVLSGDYTFPNSFYVHSEVLYNNLGKTNSAGLFAQEANELGLLSPSRWSLFQEFSYNISPLVRGSIFGIINPDDKSSVVVPSISYSVITNLDLYLIALIFNGENLTQYGDYGTSFYARLKYSF